MKSKLLVLMLLIFPFFVSAQENQKDAVVSPVKMNILYRGIANPVEIAVPGITSDKVTATVSNGSIKKAGSGWDIVPGDQPELTVSVLVNNKKVSDKTFRVKNIPNPVAVFYGKNNGSISRDNATKADGLEAELKDFDWDLKFRIESFAMMYSDGKTDFEFTSNGNKLTDQMKSALAEFQRGQKIIFKDIKATGPDGKSRELNPVLLKID